MVLAGCATHSMREVPRQSPAVVQAQILQLMPSGVSDRKGWAVDISAAFAAQNLPASTQNLCSVLAVTEQESGFHVHSVIPGLPAIARRAIDQQAAERHVPRFMVDAALWLKSPDGQRYRTRLQSVRTESQMSDMFQDFIGVVPLGKQLFGGFNPVHTGGPMQVSVSFAEAHDDNYPYPVQKSIRHEVFTRRGGMYFGIMHLLGFPVHYPRPIYLFADYNAGWYASRNAAFQHAVSLVTGIPLQLDGDLISYQSSQPGHTELAVRTLGKRLNLSDRAIHDALERSEQRDFRETRVYKRVFALADRMQHKALPRVMLPYITLHSPKITHTLTTAWFARRVDGRYERCMARGAATD
ncbi:MAG: DUF1615 domain-containing protein [Rhodanobacteraceae bacterium]